MEQMKIAFVGLGLIGGSMAKTIKRIYPDTMIVAYDTDAASIEQAMKDSIIDIACTDIDSNFSLCNYIFLCAPVTLNDSNLLKIKPYLTPDTILSDVGSVKSTIHKSIFSTGLDSYFIGGHPMTGSEKSGYLHSTGYLMENAYYILTPSSLTDKNKVTLYQSFVASLGAIPLIMDADTHDYVTASVSHLPHILASSLVNFVSCSDTKEGYMQLIAAGGFKDITRIASSSPVMWQQIVATNSEHILHVLDNYLNSLQALRRAIYTHDSNAIYSFFSTAKDYRDTFIDAASGPIKKVYAVYCDIVDETGAIASIATILAANSISIKNIGIVHNREFEEGVLRIDFYEKSASIKATALLELKGYIIIRRN